MRAIADDLALAQSPVSEEDLMVHILSQLGEDNSTIAAAIKVRDTPLSYPELFDKLADYERALKETSSTLESIPTTVNYTSRHQGTNHRTNHSSSRANRSYSATQSKGAPQSPWSGTNSPGNRPNRSNNFCQYCNIPCHLTTSVNIAILQHLLQMSPHQPLPPHHGFLTPLLQIM